MKRKYLLLIISLFGGYVWALNISSIMMETTIQNTQKYLNNGTLNSKKIVNWYIKRINKLDTTGYKLNSVLQLNPDVYTIATNSDRKFKKNKPLRGITVLLKDNIDTADKMETTAGSFAMLGTRPQKDAHVVKKLRESGAIILGKANMSEWAGLRALNIKTGQWHNGWSARGGMSKNPFNLNLDTWGSSSGPAVAVSSNLVHVALGTETGGSIILPASANGVVGLKPTVALIGRGGVIPISHSFDSLGILSRNVTDAAIVLGVLVGNDDARDTMNRQISKDKFFTDYTKFLKGKNLKGIRIGILKSKQIGILKKIRLPKKISDMLKKSGAILVPIDVDAEMKQYLTHANQLSIDEYEFKTGLNKYLKTRIKTTNPMYKNWPTMHNLSDIVKFNKENSRLELMGLLGQQILIDAQRKTSLNSLDYKKTLQNTQMQSRQFINIIFKKHKLDVFMSSFNKQFSLSDPTAAAGYPKITIPVGTQNNIPISIELTGLPYSEPKLLKIAYFLEQHIHGRKIPNFQP